MIRIKDGFEGERIISLPRATLQTARQDAILAHLRITDIGFYPHAAYHYRERTQPISQYILIYCTKGCGGYRIGSRQYSVATNQCFILPPGQPHCYWADRDDPWTIYWVHFEGTLAAEMVPDATHGPLDIAPSQESRIMTRNAIFEELYLTLSDSYSMDNMRYATSLLHLYLASFRHIAAYRRYRHEDERIDVPDAVASIIRYMQENLEGHITLRQLSDYTGYSVSQLSNIFRKSTGDSPLSYFNRLKIQRACQLLATTTLRVNQISAKLGIDDSYYFSRLFTHVVGVSPKKYRQSSPGWSHHPEADDHLHGE